VCWGDNVGRGTNVYKNGELMWTGELNKKMEELMLAGGTNVDKNGGIMSARGLTLTKMGH